MSKHRYPTPSTPAMDALIRALAERAVAEYLTAESPENQEVAETRTERAVLLQVQDAA